MRKLFFIFCFFVSPILISAQDSPAPAGENINVESSDSQMFNMAIDLKIQDGTTAQMLSTVKSIPIKAGEKVLFFPMGVLNDGEKSGYNCMLEMEVSKYQQQPVSQE